MADVVSHVVVPVAAVAVSLVVVTGVYHVLRFLGRRSTFARELVGRAHVPSQMTGALIALWVSLPALWAKLPRAAREDWSDTVQHVLLLGIIAAVGWLVGTLLGVFVKAALRRFRVDVPDNLEARRVHTQVKIMHRVAVAVVAMLTLAAMMITFPSVRGIGTSLLASAGLVSVIAALAAQSMLSNVFAGLQLAFGDALRLDDVVVVEGEWGWIEEMTLRHVVVKIWDERRLILPTSYFTTTPFQNWTKTEASLLGTIELEVDWSVPLEEMRAELRRICESTELWDGRVCMLQVTEANARTIQARALISATNSPTQWDLRCLVRERLVTWLQRNHPTALPRVRAELGGPAAPVPAPVSPASPAVGVREPAARPTR